MGEYDRFTGIDVCQSGQTLASATRVLLTRTNRHRVQRPQGLYIGLRYEDGIFAEEPTEFSLQLVCWIHACFRKRKSG